MNIALWIAQGLLAFMFGFSGYTKVTTPHEKLKVDPRMGWAEEFSPAVVRFIGIAEIAGALGMILPIVTGTLMWLTPLAALGFALIQVLAMIVHYRRGEMAVLPFNAILLAVSLFVFFGRISLF